ncbi:Uncharacterized protein HZ326_0808 [Fusarium oxysporum f. sp. albedinis]|nr:Uncharacterized protein HZ326_0808 [Fusarium oxysporum f. sp. albedinis]
MLPLSVLDDNVMACFSVLKQSPALQRKTYKAFYDIINAVELMVLREEVAERRSLHALRLGDDQKAYLGYHRVSFNKSHPVWCIGLSFRVFNYHVINPRRAGFDSPHRRVFCLLN